MAVETVEEAKTSIEQWLRENGHDVNSVEDQNASFHFEIDYPLGSMKKQRLIQPKEYPGLIVLLNGVGVAEEHKEKLKELSEDETDTYHNFIRKAFIFAENSYDMSTDDAGIIEQIQFSYEFYTDSLTKTKLYRGLLLNHRALIYIVTLFNEKFGVPAMPEEATGAEQDPCSAN